MATAKSTAAKKKTATKKTATKKTKTATKKAAAKPSVKKATTKKAATKKTAAKKATTKSTATKKTATKTAVKKTPAKKAATKKAAPAKATAKKTSTKKATSKAKETTASKKTSAKKATSKKATAAKAAKSSDKSSSTEKKPRRKKLNVGQKPRSGKTEAITKPTSFVQPERASNPITSGVVKASPESKEAKQTFKLNDKIVYPAHGVGKIITIEKQEIAGVANELFLIVFEQEKMRLRVPTSKAESVGMRHLSDPKVIDKAVETLKGRARIKRTMWSRRAQEYEAKINSGNIISVAEVVRDLFRSAEQPEQSYSERQLFEAALDRLAREVAAVRNRGLESALSELDASLAQKKIAA